jgi:hypothetical protein
MQLQEKKSIQREKNANFIVFSLKKTFTGADYRPLTHGVLVEMIVFNV